MLNIIYSCNDKIFDGLYLSILSILRRTKSEIHFHVLTGNLTNLNPDYTALSLDHQSKLDVMIKSFNKNNEFSVIDCAKQYQDYFGKEYDVFRFTPYAIFRLFIPSFSCFKGANLYLDVDTLANGDISKAFNVDISKVEMCVCHDYLITLHDNNPNNISFNSGVLLINVDMVRQTKYFDKALELYKKTNPDMADQVVLNECWTKIMTWKNEYRFNYQRNGIEPDTIIKHFNYTGMHVSDIFNVKPWDMHKVHNILNLHNWDEDYKYFMQQKKQWKD